VYPYLTKESFEEQLAYTMAVLYGATQTVIDLTTPSTKDIERLKNVKIYRCHCLIHGDKENKEKQNENS
jgi:hypothetical protein